MNTVSSFKKDKGIEMSGIGTPPIPLNGNGINEAV